MAYAPRVPIGRVDALLGSTYHGLGVGTEIGSDGIVLSEGAGAAPPLLDADGAGAASVGAGVAFPPSSALGSTGGGASGSTNDPFACVIPDRR